jgi:hypothetical protein
MTSMRLTVKVILAWFVILLFAIANGGLREALLIPWLGEPIGMALSGLLLIMIVFILAALIVERFGRGGITKFLAIGAAWLVMTVLFEVVLGRFIQGRPWSVIRDQYTFADGNLWPLVLLGVGLAPMTMAKAKGLVH